MYVTATLRQPLPDNPHSKDGRPIGTPCGPGCRRPVGGSQTHCGTCHQTMRGINAFDRHRRDGHCLDLTALGLVEIDRMWATPEGHAAAAQSRDTLAATRAAA
jgi:hypothetical protein